MPLGRVRNLGAGSANHHQFAGLEGPPQVEDVS